jgi:TrmH family RNA methyltransferase
VPVSILSPHNPLVKAVRRAARQGALTADGWALAEGPHLLAEALRSRVEIHAVIAREGVTVDCPAAVRVHRVSGRLFAQLATTEAPQGVLTLVRPPVSDPERLLRGIPLVAVLDGIQEPGNAGAILRAAEAFGCTGAVFLKGTVNPFNPKALRAAAGSSFRLPLLTGLSPDELPPLPLYAADPRAARSLAETDLRGPCAIVIGAESRGVSPELAARATGLRIPTLTVESLNAATAAAILFYEARRQRSLAL